jgi:hypothetical protein
MALTLQGDVLLSGEVLGGDEDGESLTIRTAALGTVRVSLDYLQLLRVRQKGRLHPPALFLPPSEGDDEEALYRETPLGLDPARGILHRVGPKGLHFAWRDSERAELFPWARIAGLRLAVEGEEEAKPAPMEVVLLTNDGCRVLGVPAGMDRGRLVLETSMLGKVRVDPAAILAGHVRHPKSRLFLTGLAPVEVDERTFWEPKPDLPWRRDRSVRGGPLLVQRRFWTVGFGCHSLSRLDFEVPEGAKSFRTWLGADDSAVGSDVTGEMDFRVFLDGKPVARKLSVKGGQKAVALPAIAVKPGQRLRLELGFAGFADILDRGNWLAPVFLK